MVIYTTEHEYLPVLWDLFEVKRGKFMTVMMKADIAAFTKEFAILKLLCDPCIYCDVGFELNYIILWTGY